MRRKSCLAIVVVIATLFSLSACSNKNNSNKYEETQFKMDTAMTISVCVEEAKEAVKYAFVRIDE